MLDAYPYIISTSHADRCTGLYHALEWVTTVHIINICTFICRVNPLLLIACTKCLVGFLHMFETQPLMLIGLLSSLEGGGLALLQPGGLGTTPTVYEYSKRQQSTSSSFRIFVLIVLCRLQSQSDEWLKYTKGGLSCALLRTSHETPPFPYCIHKVKMQCNWEK